MLKSKNKTYAKSMAESNVETILSLTIYFNFQHQTKKTERNKIKFLNDTKEKFKINKSEKYTAQRFCFSFDYSFLLFYLSQ